MMGIITSSLENVKRNNLEGILLDGYPRTLEQATLFEKTFTRANFVLYFKADESILVDRLLQRGITSGRVDDNLESIRKRLQVYQLESLPVVQYFSQQGRVREIDSAQSVEQVTRQTEYFFEQ
jgi:adenylate kinase family enzyme